MCVFLYFKVPKSLMKSFEGIFVTFVTGLAFFQLPPVFLSVTKRVTKFFFVTFVTSCDKVRKGFVTRFVTGIGIPMSGGGAAPCVAVVFSVLGDALIYPL